MTKCIARKCYESIEINKRYSRVRSGILDTVYISRLCYDVSVRLSVRQSVTEVHWRIIANLGFQSQYPNLPRIVVTVQSGAREGIIAGKSGGIISRYASHC